VIVNLRWGFSAVIAAVVGILIGVIVAAVAGFGNGSRLVIGVGVGLIIGGGLLALFDRLIVRRVLDKPARATVYEKLDEPVIENGIRITHRPVPAFDPETGAPLFTREKSSFFGLSLEVWTLFLVGFGILVVGVGVVMYLAS
jgi:hypothetical protein